jgi:aspartyl aminopeptidase
VIKLNANQRYASIQRDICAFSFNGPGAGYPCTEFCHEDDMTCGSTIGPYGGELGVRAVDVESQPSPCIQSVRLPAARTRTGFS